LEHFQVQPGETVALIGPSGSGKSTLIDLIAGIRLPAAGRIRVLGEHWPLLTEEGRRAVRRSRIGMAFQEFELLDYLTARENILLACYVGGTQDSRLALLQRAEDLAAAAGIQSILDRAPARLSQGERQRVALCRALLTRPPLILCDEPTGNLDPKSSVAVLQLLLDQAREDGATLLMATHDHALIPRFDRVLDLSGASEAGTKGRAP
ncbi:MAG: ATP-binding cassette domain-containing protein, partial [Verrucomicrobiae bacterium]|nr:ATP-binding cassette domain-containing protein [Verrucomicrobiae bacterium]